MEQLISLVGAKVNLNKDYARIVVDNIREEVTKFLSDNKGIKAFVVGLSGGLDSAVVAALCREKFTGIPLIGVSIPIQSSDDHMEKAEWVGKTYCTTYREVTYWNALWDDSLSWIPELNYGLHKDGITISGATRIRQGNMKARLRMITLYDIAREVNGIVLSTDNYSELLAGFWTLHGDVGDFGVIQQVYKGFELPVIAEVLGIREDIITQIPSDGLSVTDENTDAAQLGMDYKTFDAIMYAHLHATTLSDDIGICRCDICQEYRALEDNALVIKALSTYNATEYKRVGVMNLNRSDIGLE